MRSFQEQPAYVPLSILNGKQPPEPNVDTDISTVWQAAKERQWVGNALVKQEEQETAGGYDEEYEAPLDKLKEYNNKGYTEDELSFLSQSTSQENFVFREERILADKEINGTIQAAGGTGFAVELAAAVFDPTMIPAMFATAPAGAATKGLKIGKLGWSMLRGASEGALSEYLLKQGDTQRTNQDVLLSAVGGMALAGIIDLGVAGTKAARDNLKRANAVDAEKGADVNSIETGEAYSRADEALASEQPDPVNRKKVLSEKGILDTLKKESGGERVDVLSKKSVKAIKDEFRLYKKQKLDVIENIKKRPNLRPSARAAEIKTVEDAIARRQAELDNKVAINKEALSTNATIDSLQQGKVPDSLMDRYKELKAERGEFDATNNEFKKPEAGGKVVEEDGTEVPVQSVGAMRSRTEFDDIDTYDQLLTETDVEAVEKALIDAENLADSIPRNNAMGEVPAPLRSAYTELDGAPDKATRGLVAKLIKNPQRTTKGLQSAEEYSETLFHRAVPDYLDFVSAMDSYFKSRGIGKFDLKERAKATEDFNRETVMMQASGNLLSNKPVKGDSTVMLGAKARSRLYEQGLKNNQDYDVIGFENLKHRHEYHSVVFSQDNISKMTEQHADFVVDSIASAYQTGGIKLSRENAISLAENQIARAMSVKGNVNKSYDSFMSDAQYRKIEEELISNNVDRDIINDIKSSIFDQEQLGEISPRAMFSLRPNLRARSGDVWFVDLIDTSIERNMKYVSDSAANAGLAANGFRSKHQFQRAVMSARDAAFNDLRAEVQHYAERGNLKAKAEAETKLAEVKDGKYSTLLDEMLRLIYREPLEDGDGLKDVSRLLRKATSAVRLRTTGLATIPENATAAIRNGITNTLKQLPSTRFFDLRTKSIEKDKFMKDYNRAFSATGHQEYIFGRSFYNGSDFDDTTKGRLGKIDKMLGKALDITMTVNAFRTFQHGGEEMVARSIVNNLRDMSLKGEITPNIRSSLIDVGGMSEAQVTEMVDVFKQYPDLDVFDAVRLMSPSLHNSLSVATRNTIGSSFLRMSIGEQPAYMNKEMGKMMTTLMSFTIGSYEKMLLRGIKNERALLLATTAGQAMLGYGALVANTYIQSLGKEGSERDKYIKDRLSDDGLLWGTISRVGVFAAPLIPLQVLNTLGALPEEMKGIGRMGGVQSQALVADSLQAVSAGAQLAIKDQTNREEEQDWKAVKRVLPWYNSTMYNLTVGAATND